jgi:hypothetical protein
LFAYLVPFAESDVIKVQTEVYTKTDTPPSGGGTWKYVGQCGNGEYEWESNSRSIVEREPKETPQPTPTPTPTTFPPMNTRTPFPPVNTQTLPKPNAAWTSVLGYSNSFNQCANLCAAYQQSSCGISAALAYCSAVVSIDLNKNGKISSTEFGTTPSGTKNCDTNVRCYDVIPNCDCGSQPLNLGSCVNLFYQEYTSAGLNQAQTMSNIAQSTSGNCQPPRT